ncbi:hypothetical protein TWF696_004274 [Orbilia brochopaga]|uniref:Uncharacterized protein n=1 Tax=Orbilia brochopaga TaxID=3140254 RepID=A0AAV9V6C4_9PEZI
MASPMVMYPEGTIEYQRAVKKIKRWGFLSLSILVFCVISVVVGVVVVKKIQADEKQAEREAFRGPKISTLSHAPLGPQNTTLTSPSTVVVVKAPSLQTSYALRFRRDAADAHTENAINERQLVPLTAYETNGAVATARVSHVHAQPIPITVGGRDVFGQGL